MARVDCGGAIWGFWAAESVNSRVIIEPLGDDLCTLNGVKFACPGAADIGYALITGWYSDETAPHLVHMELAQPGVRVSQGDWHPIGMAADTSHDVSLENATGRLVGGPGFYVTRPGFWHGSAGMAACWFGGALSLGNLLREALAERKGLPTALQLAALGKVHLELSQGVLQLQGAATWLDLNPARDAKAVALSLRIAIRQIAKKVLDEVSNTLGVSSFYRNALFANLAADLPVFVRLNSSEDELARLGECLLGSQSSPWAL